MDSPDEGSVSSHKAEVASDESNKRLTDSDIDVLQSPLEEEQTLLFGSSSDEQRPEVFFYSDSSSDDDDNDEDDDRNLELENPTDKELLEKLEKVLDS